MAFTLRSVVVLSLAILLFACSTDDTTPIRAGEDYGPKPTNPQEIATRWFNSHYDPPVAPGELSVSEPSRIAVHDILLGRSVGWQIILGPENKKVTYFTEMSYTRLIVKNGQIISVTWSDRPFVVKE
ncbi:MAG TPA: hypothetical protein VK961_16320 [Chthoniobacter sp.]|nr:hypothetical protein [Chthoniobacter sp.]